MSSPKPALDAPVCAACRKDIPSVRIECAVCTGVSLCIECFASGSEAPEVGHTRTHSYRVHENLQSFSLFDKEWTAEDELLLLQGIDMYGMGNWRCVRAGGARGGRMRARARVHSVN